MKSYAIGVDIGGTTVKIGLFRTNGELLESWEIPTRTENGGALILGDIAASVNEHLAAKGIDKAEVEGLGMGVPGPVGADGTVFKCVNLGWGVFNVEETMAELTGLKIKAGNDANVAALGELWQGGGKGCSNAVMITLGTGVGGGVILGGKILAGTNGAAGELGHIPMFDDDPEVCGCGKRGCLEQYASANGIVRLAHRYFAAHPEAKSPLLAMERYTSKEIFDEARKGDPDALAIAEECCRLLGKACAFVACVADPEVFVIGGGMSKAGQILIDLIQKHYVHFAFHASRGTQFRLAELGNNAGIFGGVRMVLD